MKISPIIVLDNGASTVKAGVLNGPSESRHPKLISNAVVRSKGDKTTYIGHELERCRDYASLHYRLPFEKVRPHTDLRAEGEAIFLQELGLSRGLGLSEGCMGWYILL
jgi:hypothetical protein